MKDISGVTKEELIKAIYRECLGCQGMKEERIYDCDLLTCPFHQFIKYHTEEPTKPKEKIIDTAEQEPKKGKRK